MRRALLSGCGLLALLAATCLVPLPHRIVVPAVIDPHNARRMYVTVPGLLEDARYESRQIRVVRGERIVFYTDGIVESAPDNEARSALEQQIRNILWQTLDETIDHSIREVTELFDQRTGGLPPDDATLIIAELL